MITWLIIALYITAFIYISFSARQFNWLWGSVVLWLGFGVLGAKILPGLWGITHPASLLHPYFYIALSSIFFFVNHWKHQRLPHILIGKNEQGEITSQHKRIPVFVSDPQVGALSAFWAVSGLILHLAFLLIVLLALWQYPEGNSTFALLSLLQMYFLHPIFWIGAHSLLIALMWLTRAIRQNRFAIISYEDLALLFLSSLMLCTLYVLYDVTHFIALWQG